MKTLVRRIADQVRHLAGSQEFGIFYEGTEVEQETG